MRKHLQDSYNLNIIFENQINYGDIRIKIQNKILLDNDKRERNDEKYSNYQRKKLKK